MKVAYAAIIGEKLKQRCSWQMPTPFIFVKYLSSRPPVVKELSDNFEKELSANWLGLSSMKMWILRAHAVTVKQV